MDKFAETFRFKLWGKSQPVTITLCNLMEFWYSIWSIYNRKFNAFEIKPVVVVAIHGTVWIDAVTWLAPSPAVVLLNLSGSPCSYLQTKIIFDDIVNAYLINIRSGKCVTSDNVNCAGLTIMYGSKVLHRGDQYLSV